ncbi:hypothetical protein PR202_ga10945 [Eleusine coracana subsp. coracana]|uniref:DUF6598 domain-containing protein n=1 Tax=Eleusine coracana subsp. coracana TaxID=191504 RepID=A0AAV5C7V9_ELECO|nr:hypothetical protein PR202_ga10945 [Eleusine coracana subsp. coracana]
MAALGGGGDWMASCGVYEGLGLDEYIPGTTYKVRDFSFDPRMGEPERAARAERLRQEARNMEDEDRARRKRAQARILDFDPKQNGIYYNRLSFVDLETFDLDECDVYVETDLKIKDDGGQEDKQLSKGVLTIRGIARRDLTECELETGSLATRFCTVSIMYSVVIAAVEGTIAIEAIQGNFDGKITACATSIQKSLVLYDSEVAGTVNADDNGLIQLLQPVISVYLKEMLEVTIVARDGETKRVKFTPKLCGGETFEITVGDTQMLVQVTWSIIDY